MNIIQGDCLDIMQQLIEADIQFSAIVTDPPYNLGTQNQGFMGKKWDNAIAFNPEIWRLCLELLLPGGHLVAFGATRTYHRMVCAVEDAGFEIRDQLAWVYGSGFPKSHDVSKAIDAAAGVKRTEVVGVKPGHEEFLHRQDAHAAGGRSDGWDRPWRNDSEAVAKSHLLYAPVTAEALRWLGWGTALKPSWEPIVLARRPLSEKTVAANVLRHGTSGLNVDACRIPIDESIDDPRLGGKGTWGTASMAKSVYGTYEGVRVTSSPQGRFPSNLCHDGSEEVLEAFAQYGDRGGGDKRGQCQGRRPSGFGDVGHDKGDQEPNAKVYADKGSAARFFSKCPLNKDELFEHRVYDILEQCLSSIFVPNAEVYSTIIPPTTENSVRVNAPELLENVLSLDAIANDVVIGTFRTTAVRNIVRNVVAIASMQKLGLIGIDCQELSMTVMVSELKLLLTNVIEVILSIENEFSHERLPEKLSQINNHVRNVVIQKQTDTMIITISHWKSDGSVDPVILNIMLPNTVRGEMDSISRFMYAAKTNKRERRGSKHPTIKPVSLMRWLVKLVTPPDGIILDPFAGTGTTAEAAILEGFEYVLIERDAEYVKDIQNRLKNYE